jgi:hypothetical protein
MKKAKHDWSSHVAAINTQDTSIGAYARLHGLALSTLYYWRRKLQPTSAGSSKAKRVASAKPPGKFVALHVRDLDGDVRRPPTSCTLVLTGAMRLEMAVLPDPQWLAALWRCTHGVH